ncbi:MAG: hypothetical protein A2X86_09530 [Bdellovibrionales bacterium GWA2_49_15]|nr:MAG: hypothetical protein A2X86_09530 [Bdellovibrionales bacterium GWA2_49_15]HAZ13020.1 hypothetical protein [Bdellovibrionales bacterium]
MNKMLIVLLACISLQAMGDEFIVGVDSKHEAKVNVQIGLELTASRCYEVVFRSYVPIPVQKTKVLRQTQVINNDLAEYKFEFEKGLCGYSPTGVFFYAETADLKGNAVVRPIQDDNHSDVDLDLKTLTTAGLVHWRQWIETKSVPQVFINVR